MERFVRLSPGNLDDAIQRLKGLSSERPVLLEGLVHVRQLVAESLIVGLNSPDDRPGDHRREVVGRSKFGRRHESDSRQHTGHHPKEGPNRIYAFVIAGPAHAGAPQLSHGSVQCLGEIRAGFVLRR